MGPPIYSVLSLSSLPLHAEESLYREVPPALVIPPILHHRGGTKLSGSCRTPATRM
jgi:hypothetical protein